MSLPRKLARLAPLSVLLSVGAAAAQPSAPAPTSGAATASATPPGSAKATSAPPPSAAPASVESVSEPTKGGKPLTADVAASEALRTSKTIAVDEAKLQAAGAQVDAAWDNYWPRLSFTARYTRLSPIVAPKLGSDAVRSVVTTAPNGTVITSISPTTPLIAASTSFSFPVILDQYTFQTTLLVPVSDYVFRIYKNHESALASLEAARWTAEVTKITTATDARVAYYNYLRARGAVLIAKSAVAQASAHLKDMKNRLDAKVVTVADVARVEASLASAELAVIKTENLVILTEANLRMLMHAPDEQGFSLGEDLDAELPKLDVELPALKASAFARRPELKALDAQIASVEKTQDVVTAGLYPRLDAVGNFTYANPNQRIFPQKEEFKATWDVSLQLSWSPNDALVARDQKKTIGANLGQLKATREQIVDGLGMDVTNAYAKVREAEASLVTTKVELRAADEAYRVRKEQFTLGSSTSALLIDAEADVTRARLNHLNARVDLRIARAQLKKAIAE